MPAPSRSKTPDFLTGGGELGRLIEAHDWSSTSLGPLDQWPQSLKTATSLLLRSPVPIVMLWGEDGVMIYNDAYSAFAGARHPHILGSRVREGWPEVADFNDNVMKVVLAGQTLSYQDQELTLHRNGRPEQVWMNLDYSPVIDESGEPRGVIAIVVETTGKVRAERALRAESERLKSLFHSAPSLMAVVRGPEHVFEFANEAYHQITGHRELIGRPAREAFPEVEGQGADGQTYFDLLDQIFRTGEPWVGRGLRVELQRTPGAPLEERFVTVVYQPIVDDDGLVSGIFINGIDVTHQKRAEAQLQRLNEELERRVAERTAELNRALEELKRESGERVAAEQALRQAQRIEALGKLTGGVAHDFNNLLQVISGNLQLLSKYVAGNPNAEERVANALAGVARGSKLASQLLAFGRRQPLEPKVVNIGRFVHGMEDMLRRALGEEIEIETVVSGGLWNTFIDPGQVENALLNLAINARDAMGGIGKLTIEASNAMLDDEYARQHSEVTPGQYVMLAVTDTGSGIPPDVLERVFEPFFSTKPEGKGTGLGLSMVHGFVKQSGGHIKIYSEVGHGTTVKLYLPRSMEKEDALTPAVHGPVVGGAETILVVEDDDQVRETAVALLTELGYRVLKARDASSALNVIESGVPIDLLFTDVVMPGPLRSPELARKAKERLPNVAVLFTSGYTENAIVHGGRLDPGIELLSKPYTREALARKVRQVLGNEAQHRVAKERRMASEKAPREQESRLSRPPAGGSLTILLVEDDDMIRSSTAEMLGDCGHVVVEAADADSALQALATCAVDVLFADVGLPGVNGVELARRAKQKLPQLRIVFATGDHSVAEDAEPLGAVLLGKPYTPDDIAAALGSLPAPPQKEGA